jgi:hypothetical protein
VYGAIIIISLTAPPHQIPCKHSNFENGRGVAPEKRESNSRYSQTFMYFGSQILSFTNILWSFSGGKGGGG